MVCLRTQSKINHIAHRIQFWDNYEKKDREPLQDFAVCGYAGFRYSETNSQG